MSKHSSKPLKAIRVNSFFTGIGGFDLGFEKAGFEVNLQCEINEFCIKILEDRYPNVKRFPDVKSIKIEDIPDADIWCAGFPCQDVSVARGSMGRDGLKGKNSGLFYDFLNLISQKKPEMVLIENVTGLLNSHNGNDFKIVIQSLTSLGYGVSWRVLNTKYFGTPQSRPRVYISAWLNNLEKAVYSLHEFVRSVKVSNQRIDFLSAQKNNSLGITVPKTAYCLAASSGRHTGTDWSRTYVSYYNKVRRLTPDESEGLQGFPKGWTIPINVKEMKKISDIDTLRYHAIGNAVSVPVIVWIACRIKEIKGKKTLNKGVQKILKKFPDFSQPDIRTQFFSTLNSETLFKDEEPKKIKWNNGGLAFVDEVIDANIYNCPSYAIDSNLIDIIEEDVKDSKYFLSPSAARGIIRRVESQNRKLFTPLMNALIKLANSDAKSLARF